MWTHPRRHGGRVTTSGGHAAVSSWRVAVSSSRHALCDCGLVLVAARLCGPLLVTLKGCVAASSPWHGGETCSHVVGVQRRLVELGHGLLLRGGCGRGALWPNRRHRSRGSSGPCRCHGERCGRVVIEVGGRGGRVVGCR